MIDIFMLIERIVYTVFLNISLFASRTCLVVVKAMLAGAKKTTDWAHNYLEMLEGL